MIDQGYSYSLCAEGEAGWRWSVIDFDGELVARGFAQMETAAQQAAMGVIGSLDRRSPRDRYGDVAQ
jgi:hypothetical protein